jgi:hypothetical protein
MMKIQRRTANKAEQWAELDYQWDKIVEHARSAEQDYLHGSERGIGAGCRLRGKCSSSARM